MLSEREMYTTPFDSCTSTSCISSRLKDLVRLLVSTMFKESLLFLDATNCWMYLLEALISSTSLEIFTLPSLVEVRHFSKAACKDCRWLRSERNWSCKPAI